MKQRFSIAFVLLVFCYWPLSSMAQCGFGIVPAASVNWYRAEGWHISGIADAKSIVELHLTVNDKDYIWPDGISVSMVMYQDNYNVRFPEVIFEDSGDHKKMLSRVFGLSQLLRWEMNGKTYAYSYLLIPHDVACSSTIDIIDDKGDGKFRVMTSPGHVIQFKNPTPPPVPEWLKQPQS